MANSPNTNNISVSTTPYLVGDLRTTITGTSLSVPNSNPTPTAVSTVPVAACFEIQSTTGLLLIPRLTDANITTITTANPTGIVDGMIYYNEDDNAFVFRQNGADVPLPTGAGTGNVVGPTTPIAGTLAYFPSNLSPNIQDTNSGTFGINILAEELIVSGSPGTANQLATFTGTTLTGGAGGVIQGVPVTISGGAVAGVTTIAAGLGAVGAPSYTFTGNTTTGIYSATAGVSVDVTVGGVQSLKVLSTATQFPDGTAALPAITFLSETDTGMYRIGANTVGFGANGGINFSVAGTIATSATYLTAAGAAATGTGTASIATLTATSTDTNASIRVVPKGNGALLNAVGAIATPSYSFVGDIDTGMWSFTPGTINFSSNGASAFQISSAGVVVPNGTAALPGISFAAEFDTGFWHQNTNVLGFSAAGANQFSVTGPAAAVNYVVIGGAITTESPNIAAFGTDTNVSLDIVSQGTGAINFLTAGGAANQFQVIDTAGSIVNRLTVTGNTTGLGPVLSTAGEANMPINITTNGTEAINLSTGGGLQVKVANTASADHYLTLSGSATGVGTGTGAPSITANGVEAQIDINLNTVGTTGAVAIRGSGSNSGKLRLYDNDESAFVALAPNATTTSYTLTFPAAAPVVNASPLLVDTSGAMTYGTVVFQTATVTLSSADILGMSATPVQVLAAPGAGFFTKVLIIETELVAGGIAYVGGGNVIAQYDTTALGAGAPATSAIPASSVTAAVDTVATLAPTGLPLAKSLAENLPIYISNQSAAFTAGDGTINLTILYTVISAA